MLSIRRVLDLARRVRFRNPVTLRRPVWDIQAVTVVDVSSFRPSFRPSYQDGDGAGAGARPRPGVQDIMEACGIRQEPLASNGTAFDSQWGVTDAGVGWYL